MPILLLVLAAAVFVQATSEFMLAGLVSPIACDLDVPLAAAGALTSAFAVGMVLGAPLTAVVAHRLPVRTSLTAFLSVFVAVHVAGAVASTFWLLAATRVLAAFANAGFLAVALVAAARSVPAGRTARATATLLAGTSLALIAGVPAGAVVGEALGWRATFWVVAALSAVALVGVLRVLPGGGTGEPDAAPGPLRRELAVLAGRPVVVMLVVGALVNGGTFAAYTYLAPLLTGAAGLPVGTVPPALALFGLGAFAGVVTAGRIGDTRFRTVLVTGSAALVVGWAAFAGLLGLGWPAVPAVALLGWLGFAVGSTAIARSLRLTGEAGTLGGAVTTAALNVGATIGPLLGGWGLARSATGPVWVAAGLVLLASLALVVGPVRRGPPVPER
ncbi:MFS transporter [Pseudonocardia sp. NPDC049635]|uniref:MFS transporter n=1 Tax=Pseudonocardia sp. NPDC049635 TaxID=3155506 RepID=UPI0033C94B5C